MITKISKLKDFGIFSNFNWGQLDEFKTNNLIYGWNYSGKTTLSKLFQELESKGSLKCFSKSEFSVDYEQGGTKKTVTEQNIEIFPYQVRVFNSEYIKRVFTWDDPKSDIEPISFYLGDPAGNILTKINSLESINKRLANVRELRYQKSIDTFNSYSKQNGKFTEKAKEIREKYLPKLFKTTNEFDKRKVEEISNLVKTDLPNHLLTNDHKLKYRQEALEEKEFDPQDDKIRIDEGLKGLSKEVKIILEDTAPKAISFPQLDKDEVLFDWVQKGIDLHENEKECKFCTQKLPEDRIDNLNSYYSKKLKEIQDAITQVKILIAEEKKLLKRNFIDRSYLAKAYRSQYSKGLEVFNKKNKEYNYQLSILESDLKRKSGQFFTPIEPSSINLISFSDAFDDIENAIEQHNTWLSEFDDRKGLAKSKILNHYVAEYLNEEDYLVKEKICTSAISVISKINTTIDENESSIIDLHSQLSDKIKGQEELNKSLEILLHRSDIRIEIRDEKFTLERSGNPASSLSEGEKSAIAFSYFLTELKSLRKETKLKETIIFIDDPISSLDSNHIFQVRSLIQTFFSIKDFCQLFVSTHNFEFLSVLLDTRLFGSTNKEVGEQKRPLYFIQRSKDNKAIIKKLPKSFSSYKSEYVGLFHIIKDFNELDDKDEFPNILILPNAVRRFLELYTLMKYPSNNEVDNRVKTVFEPDDKPYHNTKLLHWFSHQNQYEKVQRHDDKLLQIEGAIEDLLTHIESNDKLHWKGLVGE